MNNFNFDIVESRNISDSEYKTIVDFLDKYKFNKDNFINNCKTLKLNKIDTKGYIYNGYDSIKNEIVYNSNSNLICELFHVASSKGEKEQGIIVKPNRIYKKSLGFSLNEGITDLLTSYCIKKNNSFFVFEKMCAKTLEYVYGFNIFNDYFLNDDGNFRQLFNKNYIKLLISLDDYCSAMLNVRTLLLLKKELPTGVDNAIKLYMDVVIDNLCEVTKDSDKDCKKYIKKLLTLDEMNSIYDIIGEYEYDG